MIAADAEEAAAVLGRILDALLLAVPGATAPGRAGGDLRRVIGDLKAVANNDIRAGAVGAAIAGCFAAATTAGATIATYDHVRQAIAAEQPKALPAVAITTATLRYALIETSTILSTMVFVSRDQIDRIMLQMNAAFDPAETQAADARDTETYRAIVALHAAVVRHLAQSARPLPRMLDMVFGARMPSLYLANRIYADASRSGELIQENNIVHPMFAPRELRALAS